MKVEKDQIVSDIQMSSPMIGLGVKTSEDHTVELQSISIVYP